MKDIRVLNIDQSDDDSMLLLREFEKGNYRLDLKRVETAEAFHRELEGGEWDLIISDYAVRNFTSIEALDILRESGRDIPFIIISGKIDQDNLIRAMRKGANDFLAKDDLPRLLPVVTRELNEATNRREKRATEKALAESEARLHLALAAAEMGAWEWDLSTDDVFWSPECSIILGIPLGGTKVQDINTLIVDEDKEFVAETLRNSIAGRTIFKIRFRILRKEGEIVWIAQNGRCEYDDQGTPVRMAGTIRDITREKKAEDALIDAEELYRIVAETANDALISINDESTIIFANSATEEIFGYTRGELIGSDVTMLMPFALKAGHKSGVGQYHKTGEKKLNWRNLEFPARKKDGTEIFVQVSLSEYTGKGKHSFTGIIRDVTEKKHAENAIRESEEDFRKLAEASTQIVWKLDENGDIKETPHWWTEMTGQTVEASKNFGWLDLIHPDDSERIKAIYLASIETKTHSVSTFRMKTAARGYRHFAGRSVPVFSSGGVFRHFICTLSDITERMAVEEKVRENEEKYRNLVDTMTEGLGSLDRNGNLTFLNNRACEMLGYELDELLGKPITQMFDEQNQKILLEQMTARRRGESDNYEITWTRKDGKKIDTIISPQPNFDENGEFAGSSAVFTDITGRKAAELELKNSEARFRSMIEQAAVGVGAVDKTGKWQFANERMCSIFGYTEAELSRFTYKELTHPDDRDLDNTYMPQMRSGKISHFSLEKRYLQKNGSTIWANLSAAAVRDDAGEIQCFMVVIVDISARRIAEQKLRESEIKLRTIVETDPECVKLFDKDCRLLDINKAGLDMIEADSPDQIIGTHVVGVLLPEYRQAFLELNERVFRGESGTLSFEIEGLKGTRRFVETHAVPLRDSEGEITAHLAVTRDVTTKKLALEALEKSEERYRRISSVSFDYVFSSIVENGGNLGMDWTAGAFEKITGYSTHEYMERGGWRTILHSDDFEKDDRDFEKLMRNQPVESEIRIVNKSGDTVWIQVFAQPIWDSGQNVLVGINGAVHDITSRKKIENYLTESQQRYSGLINTIEGIVWEANAVTYDFTFVSEHAKTILGYDLERWYEPNFWGDHIHDDDREWAVDYCIKCTAEKIPHSFEYRMIAADGSVVWLHDLVSLVIENDVPVLLRGIMFDITENRKRDNALYQQAMLIEQASEAIIVWDLKDGIIQWNKGCERLYGYTRKEVLGKFGYKLLKSKFPFPLEQFLSELAEKRFWSGEIMQTAKDGHSVSVDARYQVIDIEGRQIVLQTNRDATDRRRAEFALRDSETRYRHLFENNPYPMWVYDVKTFEFLAVNDAAVFRYGFTRDEFLSMNMTDIHPPEQIDEMIKKANSARRRIDSSGNWRHKKKDGTIINVKITSHALEFAGRKSRLVLSHDITERLLAEKALKSSEEKYRELFENANDLIYTHDLAGNFMSLNRAGENITGYSEAEARKLNVSVVIAPEYLESVRKIMYGSLRGSDSGAIHNIEIISKNGSRVSLEVNIRIIYHEGKAVGVQGIGRDMTERKLAEAALRESQQQQQQSQKLESIGILAGGMAHDFNNMLTAINGYSDLILRKISTDNPLRHNVEEIRKAGERSAELTRQLLAFSRRQILQPKVIDINHVIDDTSSMLQRLIGENIRISTKLDPRLWKIEADPGQFAQILTNFIVNAKDAMPNGGSVLIETENVGLDEGYASHHVAVKPGNYVMLAVSDNGTGMDEATRLRIFEPFFTTKDVGHGTGLGLSTVYGIVKQSGGNIWVYSEPGKGTTFKIYLPQVNDRKTPGTDSLNHLESLSGNETVLLVEDEEAVRSLSREILESCGYTVIEASNGVEALNMCRDNQPKIDLLMTDIVMPQMGGRELAEKMLETVPAMKILFTSGYTDDAILRHGIIDEGTNFLQKPFTFDALARKVKSLLEQ